MQLVQDGHTISRLSYRAIDLTDLSIVVSSLSRAELLGGQVISFELNLFRIDKLLYDITTTTATRSDWVALATQAYFED